MPPAASYQPPVGLSFLPKVYVPNLMLFSHMPCVSSLGFFHLDFFAYSSLVYAFLVRFPSFECSYLCCPCFHRKKKSEIWQIAALREYIERGLNSLLLVKTRTLWKRTTISVRPNMFGRLQCTWTCNTRSVCKPDSSR